MEGLMLPASDRADLQEVSEDAGWIRDARRAVREAPVNYFAVSPWRYWTDFLVSLTIAYTSATIYLVSPLGSWAQLIAFPLAVFWLYRLGSLIHEVCHLGHHEMRVFKVVWNLLVGVMTLMPSPFFTRHHRDHHSTRMYGTPEDPEYVANVLEAGSWKSSLIYTLMVMAFPIAVFLRFLLVPFTYLTPAIRKWTLEHGSAFTLNTRYTRRVTPFDRKVITALEWPCFLRAAFIPGAVLAGLAPPERIPLLYLLALSTVVLNQLRQLADHHFEGDGSPATVESHILDSCNYTGSDVLTWLFFPFSIRYHALHHLFPSMPYHNLKPAHEYLARTLPADSPYLGLDEPGWWSVARRTIFGHHAAA